MVILDGKFPFINLNATLNGRMKHRLLAAWMGISLSISNSVLPSFTLFCSCVMLPQDALTFSLDINPLKVILLYISGKILYFFCELWL
jgi:hypothetical protein